MHPFSGRVDPNTVQQMYDNEVRAIENLCDGKYQNIVKVFRHGLLRPDHSIYYIDMEMCDFNLDEYVTGTHTDQSLLDWPNASKQDQIQYLLTTILDNVLSGLTSIHSHNEVHRDISPQNSTPFKLLD